MLNIKNIINDFFIKSRDFNGIHLLRLKEETGLSEEDLIRELIQGIENDSVSIQFGVNPHIIRLDHFSQDQQIDFLNKGDIQYACAYPTEKSMQNIRDISEFNETPYSKRLALAEAQLTPVYFDMSVLERYATDPRYVFKVDDYQGYISTQEEYYEGDSLKEFDKIFLKSFGIGHTSERNKRVVCVYLRYLHNLSPEHQIFWSNKEVKEKCKPFYYYTLNTALNGWEFGETVFTVFLIAIKEINDLTEFLYGQKLFHKDFRDNTPKEFTFLLSPTLNNYFVFIHLLDKMTSENINKKFFKGKIKLETALGGDKKTIGLLNEWLQLQIPKHNFEDLNNRVVQPIKDVRKFRQKPAHKIQTDEYDPDYLEKQNIIMEKISVAFMDIHKIVQMHDNTSEFKGNLSDFSKMKIYKI